MKFSVQLRAIKHLTADLVIEADSLDEARARVEEIRPYFGWIDWDASAPEDFQIEAINEIPA